jgi:hypothetical protein
MAARPAVAKPPLRLKPATGARACPAHPPVLIRTAGLLAVAAAVILALPPLSRGGAAVDTPLLGIVSPSGIAHRELPASMARRQPPPRPVLREGRLATQSAPAITGSIAPSPAPRAVTVDMITSGPVGGKAPPPQMADLTPSSAQAPAAPAAAIPMARPSTLPQPAAAAGGRSEASTAALVEKARHLIARGRLGDGRALLKQAIAGGSPHAATILAKTYDPAVLKSWHVKGAKVDPAEARHWYEKAQELGSPAAKAALNRLQ